MRIIVCSVADIKSKAAQFENFFDDEKFFITIKSSSEIDWAVEVYDPIRVLQLTFDDEPYDETEQQVRVFGKNHARAIKRFVDSLNPKKTLYINCTNGNTRSAAVGMIINQYINEFLINNQNDSDFFKKINRNLTPDKSVQDLLSVEFFGDFSVEDNQ
jgi:predicted protein tyrosine phosphatase